MADDPKTNEKLTRAIEQLTKQVERNTAGFNRELKKSGQLTESLGDSFEEIAKSLKKKNDILENTILSLTRIGEITTVQDRRAAYRAEALQAELDSINNLLAAEESKLEVMIQEGTISEEARKNYEIKLEAQRESVRLLKGEVQQMNAAASAADDVAKGMLGIAGITDKMRLDDKFANAVGEAGGLVPVLQAVGKRLMDNTTKTMLLSSASSHVSDAIMGLAMAAIKQMVSLDNLEAQMRRMTGGNHEYSESIREVYLANRINGVSAEDAASSVNTLYTEMSTFTRYNKATRSELANTGALLERMGVSNEAFAGGLEVSTKMLGMTAIESRDTQTDIARFATELGVAPETMAAGFKNAGPIMAKFSINATKAFKNVAKAAKATGIEMDRILDYTQRFDTFEGAAEQVGSLNAMLGGDYINAMDLMATEDPAERMKMITDAIHDSGKAFEEMSYYEKIAIAEASGFQDVGELAKAMSGDMDTLNTSTEEHALTEEQLAENAKINQSLQEKLANTMAELARAIMDVMDGLNKFMVPIMKFVAIAGPVLFPALLMLKGLMWAVQIKTAMATAATEFRMIAQLKAWAVDKLETAQIWLMIKADEAKAAIDRIRAATTGASTAATAANTGAQNLSTAATIRGRLAIIGQNIARGVAVAGTAAWAVIQGVWAIATGAGTVATLGATVATWGLNTALITATGGLILIIPLIIAIAYGLKKMWEQGGIAKGIVIALGIAAGAALVAATGGLILLVPLVIGLFLGLKKVWDGLKEGATWAKIVGGILLYIFAAPLVPLFLLWQFWDKIKAGFIIGAKAIFNALTWPFQKAYDLVTSIWDGITGFFTSKIDTIKAVFMSIASVGKTIANVFKWPFNALIGIINKFIGFIEGVFTLKIRVPKILPGPSKFQIGPPNMGRIPKLAKGTEAFAGGMAMVGEKGPEMVNMPAGTSVTPAEKTKKFVETLAQVANMTAKIAGAMGVPGASAVAGVTEKVTKAVGGGQQESPQPVQVNITLELDKRVLARHTEEIMVAKLNPASA